MLKKVETNLTDKQIFIVNKKEIFMQDLTSKVSNKRDRIKQLRKADEKLLKSYQKEMTEIFNKKYKEKHEKIRKEINELQKKEADQA